MARWLVAQNERDSEATFADRRPGAHEVTNGQDQPVQPVASDHASCVSAAGLSLGHRVAKHVAPEPRTRGSKRVPRLPLALIIEKRRRPMY
jgi:hypothetical protein